MALTLDLPVKFLNSEDLPQVCVYSGRTDKINERSQSFDYQTATMRTITIVLFFVNWLIALVVYMITKKTVSVRLPQAPGQRAKCGWIRNLFWWPVLLLPALACFVGILAQPRGNLAGILALIGFLIGLGAAIAIGIWSNKATVGIKPIDEDTVRFQFPDKMQATYQIWKDAHDSWRGSRGRRGSRRADNPDDAGDDWADDAGGDWDESKKKT